MAFAYKREVSCTKHLAFVSKLFEFVSKRFAFASKLFRNKLLARAFFNIEFVKEVLFAHAARLFTFTVNSLTMKKHLLTLLFFIGSWFYGSAQWVSIQLFSFPTSNFYLVTLENKSARMTKKLVIEK